MTPRFGSDGSLWSPGLRSLVVSAAGAGFVRSSGLNTAGVTTVVGSC